tara:strand:+ start:1249 stop:1443 length:195 start_codon:yes stop_codon:yes gene_type:complete
MGIIPEIIPPSSNEGAKASNVTQDWYKYIVIVIGVIAFSIIIKFIIESFLISLGLFYIWRLASK